MKAKDGSFVIIARDDEYKLIEVSFKDESKPLYKIYKGKTLLSKRYGTEKLSELPVDMIEETEIYLYYLDVIERNREWHHRMNNRYSGYNNPIYGSNSNYGNYGSVTPHYEPPKKKTGFYDELTKSNTLVFHKTDPSTTMLGQVYEGKGWDVLHSCYDLDQEELFRVVDAHERIICLGHGYPGGLMGMFGGEMAPHFKDKKLFIIWCNADAYFTRYNIGQGQFITGNMPSEVWECRAAGCGDISAQEMLDNITYWSKLCADVTEKCLNGDVASSVRYIREEYIKKYGDHPVTVYNSVRTKVHGTSMEQNEKEVEEIYKKLGKEVPKVKQPTYSSYGGYGGYGSYGGRGLFSLNNDEQDD